MGKLLQTVTALFRRWLPTPWHYPALDVHVAQQHLHLVGSIHMGTRDMSPLPQALVQQLARADALVVEADITDTHVSPFNQTAPDLPLADRLTADEWAQLVRLCDELKIDPQHIDTLPGWQIALMMQAQQAQRLGLRASYGIDYQLLQQAKALNKPIIELEGPESQIAMLRALPENGMALLRDTLTHWHTNARLLQTMMSWWMAARPNSAELVLPATFSDELNSVLMHQRNLRWREQLLALPAGDYVVAVGALHLYGEGNLPSLLHPQSARNEG
ncbi:conjugal transfer protein TraB [Enterobacterales bacterium CwR94]|nr:conjugal transfer protein TraB [Enterobacterales bacterium CwR94]